MPVYLCCGSDIECKLRHVVRKAVSREQQKHPTSCATSQSGQVHSFLCFDTYIYYASSRLQLDFALSNMGYRVRVPCGIP